MDSRRPSGFPPGLGSALLSRPFAIIGAVAVGGIALALGGVVVVAGAIVGTVVVAALVGRGAISRLLRTLRPGRPLSSLSRLQQPTGPLTPFGLLQQMFAENELHDALSTLLEHFVASSSTVKGLCGSVDVELGPPIAFEEISGERGGGAGPRFVDVSPCRLLIEFSWSCALRACVRACVYLTPSVRVFCRSGCAGVNSCAVSAADGRWPWSRLAYAAHRGSGRR